MNVTIEKAKTKDLVEIEQLYNDVCDYLATKEYNPGWRKGFFPAGRDALEFLEKDALYIAKMNEKVVGSAAFTYDPNTECFFAHIVAVHPDYMHCGIGTALLQCGEQLAREQSTRSVRLYVWEKNSVAISAYERNGYMKLDRVDIGLAQYGLEWFFLYEKEVF